MCHLCCPPPNFYDPNLASGFQLNLARVHIGHTASDTCAPPTHFYDLCQATLKARTSYKTYSFLAQMPHFLFLWVKYQMLRQSGGGGGWKDLPIKSLQPTPLILGAASHPPECKFDTVEKISPFLWHFSLFTSSSLLLASVHAGIVIT